MFDNTIGKKVKKELQRQIEEARANPALQSLFKRPHIVEVRGKYCEYRPDYYWVDGRPHKGTEKGGESHILCLGLWGESQYSGVNNSGWDLVDCPEEALPYRWVYMVVADLFEGCSRLAGYAMELCEAARVNVHANTKHFIPGIYPHRYEDRIPELRKCERQVRETGSGVEKFVTDMLQYIAEVAEIMEKHSVILCLSKDAPCVSELAGKDEFLCNMEASDR